VLRIFRAFAWLRWRVLMNALERGGRRDAVERLSRVTEQLAPILLGLLLVPGAIALALVGLFAGRAMAGGDFTAWAPFAARFTLAVLFVTAALSPLLFPAARQPRNLARLLLLPIPTRVLFGMETASCLADPWIAIVLPPLVSIPIGLAWGGHLLAALVAVVSGAALYLLLLGIAFLATSLFQLVMRDRRRSELAAIILVFIPLVFIAVQQTRLDERREARRRSAEAEAPAGARADGQWWFESPIASPAPYFPTEMYAATQLDPRAAPRPVLFALAGLAGLGLLVQGTSWWVYRRLLAGPASSHARTPRGASRPWTTLPGLTPGASAVALAELRLMTRAPRGRIALVTPLAVTAFLSVPVFLRGEGLSLGVPSGAVFALLAGAFALLAIGPIALNQFAADGAGLSLQLLAPVEDRELVAGKAWGLAAAALGAGGLAQAGIFALFRDTPLAVAFVPPLAVLASAFAVSPAWAILSAVFPRTVNLNSVGRDGNPHGLANLLGGIALVVSLVPSAGIGLLAWRWLERPALALPMTLAWCAVAWLVGRLLLPPAVRTLRARRENLALVAGGR